MSDMLQRVDASAKQWSATLMVKAGQRVKTLKAFGSALSSIVGSNGVTEEGLLFDEPFSVCVWLQMSCFTSAVKHEPRTMWTM